MGERDCEAGEGGGEREFNREEEKGVSGCSEVGGCVSGWVTEWAVIVAVVDASVRVSDILIAVSSPVFGRPSSCAGYP